MKQELNMNKTCICMIDLPSRNKVFLKTGML